MSRFPTTTRVAVVPTADDDGNPTGFDVLTWPEHCLRRDDDGDAFRAHYATLDEVRHSPDVAEVDHATLAYDLRQFGEWYSDGSDEPGAEPGPNDVMVREVEGRWYVLMAKTGFDPLLPAFRTEADATAAADELAARLGGRVVNDE